LAEAIASRRRWSSSASPRRTRPRASRSLKRNDCHPNRWLASRSVERSTRPRVGSASWMSSSSLVVLRAARCFVTYEGVIGAKCVNCITYPPSALSGANASSPAARGGRVAGAEVRVDRGGSPIPPAVDGVERRVVVRRKTSTAHKPRPTQCPIGALHLPPEITSRRTRGGKLEVAHGEPMHAGTFCESMSR
jgi:hypothetical protein